MTITSFDDFCLWVYVLVDDGWKTIGRQFRRPGPQPTRCSDSELLTMALVSECRGWDMETDLLSHWQEHRDLFPNQPTRTRFNRRRRHLKQAFDLLRLWIIEQLDLAWDRQCLLDSLPVPVVEFHHAPRATRQWAVDGATFGKVSSKQETIYGYKLHLLTTVSGVMLDYILAPANVRDLPVGEELLSQYRDLRVLADKAYISAPAAAELLQQRNITLLTWPRRNQRLQLPQALRKPFQDLRRRIETLNGQLTEQFKIERNHALSCLGLCARLATKLTAHTLCVFINRLLDQPNCLHIKQLAFPN